MLIFIVLVLVTPIEILLLFVLASHLKIFVVVVVFRLPLLVMNSLVIVPSVIVTVISIVRTVIMITASAKRQSGYHHRGAQQQWNKIRV